MRNLKKTLCLILALVFVLGLCTVGAADIEFSDEKDIQYKEAVQAMAGLGILAGYPDGSFKPTDTLTRAEAAKIISYVVLGPAVESWPEKQVFDDVPANHWAAKYVSYCSNRNIINGVGNNKFDPNGKVTQVAVAKMLLAACGYGIKGEFTGADWDTNVFDYAYKTQMLQGLNRREWYAEATREETAQLAYTTLMKVVQVNFNSTTSDYEPSTVNGATNVTLAESAWGLRTDEGVIIANKSNDSSAKGTVLYGARVMKYYITEEDENPAKLGHFVRITYTTKTVNNTTVGEAFFIEDKCTEVKGTEAAMVGQAETVFSFSNGKLVSYNVPAREARATAPGTFVLNEDGVVVSYKTEGYFISVININLLTLQTTVFDPTTNTYVPVQAPTGAISGDLVTVYHMGDVYTAKLCPKQTGVYIEQMGRDTEGNCTYNNGAIYPSKADNVVYSALPTYVTRLGGTAPQLELGSRYTLYFDDQGGCIGFSDKAGSGVITGASDYGLLVYTYMQTGAGDWGGDAYYAQVILGDGTRMDKLPISKTTYDQNLPLNTVYRVTSYGSQYILTAPGPTELSIETFSAVDPYTDYTSAARIWYNGGYGGTLNSRLNTYQPKVGSTVYIVYSLEQNYTYTVRKVKAVWFQETSSSSVVPVSNSFIYVASTQWKSQGIDASGKLVSYYDGYLNGTAMNDLALTANPTRTGFATYSKSGSIYTLSFLGDGNGDATGVRHATLTTSTDPSYTPDCLLQPTLLYLRNSTGWQSMNLTGVTVTKVGAAMAYPLSISTVNELINLVNAGYVVTIDLVEIVSGSTHSIGGSAIYVTGIAQRGIS